MHDSRSRTVGVLSRVQKNGFYQWQLVQDAEDIIRSAVRGRVCYVNGEPMDPTSAQASDRLGIPPREGLAAIGSSMGLA